MNRKTPREIARKKPRSSRFKTRTAKTAPETPPTVKKAVKGRGRPAKYPFLDVIKKLKTSGRAKVPLTAFGGDPKKFRPAFYHFIRRHMPNVSVDISIVAAVTPGGNESPNVVFKIAKPS